MIRLFVFYSQNDQKEAETVTIYWVCADDRATIYLHMVGPCLFAYRYICHVVIWCKVIGWGTQQSMHRGLFTIVTSTQEKCKQNVHWIKHVYRKSPVILLCLWYTRKASMIQQLSFLMTQIFWLSTRPTHLHTNDMFDHVVEGSGIFRTLQANKMSEIPKTSLDKRRRFAIGNSPNMVLISGKKRKACLIRLFWEN